VEEYKGNKMCNELSFL